MLKSATVASIPTCPSFSPLSIKATPIVKVAVQAQNLTDMHAMLQGLQQLNRSDNSVEVYVQENGEHILAVCGEVHLQRCIEDLEGTFANVPITVSDPIVSFKETLASNGNSIEDVTPNGRCRIKASALPLSNEVIAFIDEHAATIKSLYGAVKQMYSAERAHFNSMLAEVLQESMPAYADQILMYLQAFGPKQCGNNMLVHIGKASMLEKKEQEESDSDSENGSTSTSRLSTQDLDLHSAPCGRI